MCISVRDVSSGSSFDFLRNFHTGFYSVCNSWHSHQQCMWLAPGVGVGILKISTEKYIRIPEKLWAGHRISELLICLSLLGLRCLTIKVEISTLWDIQRVRGDPQELTCVPGKQLGLYLIGKRSVSPSTLICEFGFSLTWVMLPKSYHQKCLRKYALSVKDCLFNLCIHVYVMYASLWVCSCATAGAFRV